MGCCISKCSPKKNSKRHKEESNNSVQDKLVISEAAPCPIPHSTTKANFAPSPTSSFSSFSCTYGNGSISCSSSTSSSTASSSFLTSKDRSFSNEYLWSCVKENPHLVQRLPVKTASPANSISIESQPQKLATPVKTIVAPPTKQSIPQRVSGSSGQQKRARPNSPTLTRQKSFRREPDAANNATYSRPSRTLMRSPSPSRRFNGAICRNFVSNTSKETSSEGTVCYKKNAVKPILASVRKENLRPPSPISSSSRYSSCLRNRETLLNYRNGTKTDEIAVGQVLSNLEIDSLPVEDIENPHISLDCFIFL